MSTNVLAGFRAELPEQSDEQLLSEARSGDGKAFAELCQRYGGMLKQRIFRIVQHREDAEDVLQETFLKAYLHLDSFRGACKFSTWMIRIGINTSLMSLRKRKTFSSTISDTATDSGQQFEVPEIRDLRPNPEQRYMMHQADQRVKQAIGMLPPRLGKMIDLYYGQECRLKEIARTLGMSDGAAKSTVLRARKLLRRSLNANSNACRGRSPSSEG